VGVGRREEEEEERRRKRRERRGLAPSFFFFLSSLFDFVFLFSLLFRFYICVSYFPPSLSKRKKNVEKKSGGERRGAGARG
jgi:hypothetical protein